MPSKMQTAILLLVKHTEFSQFNPEEIAKKTKARIVIDTVNGWNREAWKNAGFQLFRLGDNKSKIETNVDRKS